MKKKPKPKKKITKKPDITDLVQIHLVTDGDDTKGWIHTHGMDALGLPELEIKGIPLFMGTAACALLNEFGRYMMENPDRPVLEGQNIQMGPALFSVKECPRLSIDEGDGHYTVRRLELVDSPALIGHCHGVAHG